MLEILLTLKRNVLYDLSAEKCLVVLFKEGLVARINKHFGHQIS